MKVNYILYILLVICIIFYIIYAVKGQIKIIKNTTLNKKQKRLNSIMIWLIPFIWYYLIKELIEVDTETMTKEKRDRLLKKDSGGFYESGKGMYNV